ncbi:MAG TPA: acetate--CoA ligase family protein [Candidatus Methylomirabilis sp.]|nr:acetate--CoA ligase family protein [Candidatus Methylomirabilis sp.]
MVLTPEMVLRIDGILAAAHGQGRNVLYEHEVYGILRAIGLEVPHHRFVREIGEVTAETLAGLGRTLVVKIVSAGIPHKQKVGGVRKTASADPFYVQFVLTRMREEVLSHFAPGEAPEIAGFLLVEHVPHTQAIGYEVLVGFTEDPAFGPVLTVSKGGDDAEFFAAHYDPANLFLPPMEYPDALAFMRSLHIRHKFEQIGHPEYLEYMARAMAGMSLLAFEYSPIAAAPRFIFTSFEVNPFVISKDNRFVALDALAEFRPASEADAWAPGPNSVNLEAFFQPKGVAVVGVSADLSKYSLGRDIAELLHDLGRGDLYLINPKGGALRFGSREYPLYRGVGDLPAPVEMVVYAAPAQIAPDFLRGLAGGSVRAVILIPGVPASVPYAEYARQVREALPPGIRVLGPNCMGVYFAPLPSLSAGHPTGGAISSGVNTLFINEKRLEVRSSERSNAVLLTQSGALAVTALDKLRGCRPFRSVVSFGNKCDVKVSDLLAYFEDDASVGVVCLYLEGFDAGEGRRFYDMARSMGTPIVAYKAGRTKAGARSAAAHTASMSGSYEVFRAACQQAGVILAETIEEYLDLVKTYSLLAAKPPAGNRVAGVVNAGFESTVGADELKGLTQAQLSAGCVERLNTINQFGLVDTSSPFLDITPMADDRMYADFVEAVICDPEVDCVFVAVVPHAVCLKTDPETCRDPDGLANLLLQLAAKHDKPMVVSVNAGRYYAEFVSLLEEGGLPVYADIRSAISSLDTFVSYRLARGGSARRRRGAAGKAILEGEQV